MASMSMNKDFILPSSVMFMTSSGCARTAGLHVHWPISVLVTFVTSKTMVIAVPSTVHVTLYVAVVVAVQNPIAPSYNGGVHCPHCIPVLTPACLCNRSCPPTSPVFSVQFNWNIPPSAGYLVSAVSDISLETAKYVIMT